MIQKFKKFVFFPAIFVLILSLTVPSVSAQKSSEKVKSEIKKALELWNTTAKTANLEKSLSLFDSSDEIMLVGSAGGEINKGKEEIRKWLGQIYGFAGFSWEMNKVDIDYNGKTAWVFVDGKMIVNFHKGGQKITPYRFTGILVKKKGVWKWRLFDGSVPQQE